MSTFALLDETSTVVNVVVADSAELFADYTVVQVPDNDIPLVGWVYSMTGFTDPNPPPAPEVVPVTVPQTVSRFQARVALYQSGHLAAIETYMADPATPMVTKLAWQDAQEFRRQSPTVLALASLLGLTATQLDDLFTFASKIVA